MSLLNQGKSNGLLLELFHFSLSVKTSCFSCIFRCESDIATQLGYYIKLTDIDASEKIGY